MPVGIVRIVYRIQALRMYRILDVENNSVPGARAVRQSDGRVHGDVMALVAVRRLILAMGAAVVQTVQCTRARIDKYARAGHYLRIPRRSDRNLDDFDAK